MNYSTLKKTVALSVVALMAVGAANAQMSSDSTKMSSDMSTAKVFGGIGQFNHWSLGINAGVNEPVMPFINNAVTHDKTELGYGVSVRDQLSHFFGLQLDYHGGKVAGNDQGYARGEKYGYYGFQTTNNQVTLSGLLDFGSVSFGHRQNAVDFYGTAGAGLAFYTPSSQLVAGGAFTKYTNSVKELVAPIGTGIKFKLSDALALNIGYTINIVQGYNFTGFHTVGTPITTYSHYSYAYGGLEYTFGSKAKKNVDWVNPIAMMYDELYDAALRAEVEALKGRVTNVETAVADLKKDSDGDGVADQFDKCPNTPAGSVVDGSGCVIVFPKDTVKADSSKTSAMTAPYSNIQFEFDSSVLRTSSYPVLDGTSADLRSSGKTITLAGYASSEGTAAHNMKLSKDRAMSVKTYLVNSGVEAKHLKIKAYGETHPIADNSTDAGRVLNRRVEFHK